MKRSDWTTLPEAVRAGITDRVGGAHLSPASTGDHAEIAATVTGTKGSVFVKAASSKLGVRSLRYELLVGGAATLPRSPTIEWQFETYGWLVAGFEYLTGPHPDLAPGSPHLNQLAEALDEFGVTPAPDVKMFTPATRLGFSTPGMTGGTLVHTDLNPANLICASTGLRVVDWAYSMKAAPWIELALLVQWLIGSGHTAAQAERWLERFPNWTATTPAELDYFATRNADKWAAKAATSSLSWVRDLASWTGKWAAHRARAPS